MNDLEKEDDKLKRCNICPYSCRDCPHNKPICLGIEINEHDVLEIFKEININNFNISDEVNQNIIKICDESEKIKKEERALI